jgi:tetratricopeptide (TPR) repeat protein
VRGPIPTGVYGGRVSPRRGLGPALLVATIALTVLARIPMASEPGPLPDFDAMWDFDHPDSTEAAFRALLPAARASGDRDYLAQLLTQVARTQGLQMKFDEAARTLGEAESLITDDMKVARVRLLLERGRVLNSSKRREESKPLFRSAWERAQEAHAGGFAVDAAHMMGIVETGDSSVQWNRTAIDFAEKSSDPKARRWLGSLYNNLGWTYHEKGEYAAALDLFQKALAAREAEGKRPLIRIANWCVARTLRSLGRTEEALAMQERLLAELTAEGGVDGYVHEEMAECLLALGRASEAKPHFAAAYRALSEDEWLRRDEADRLERLRRLGGVDAPKSPAPK